MPEHQPAGAGPKRTYPPAPAQGGNDRAGGEDQAAGFDFNWRRDWPWLALAVVLVAVVFAALHWYMPVAFVAGLALACPTS